MKNIKASISVPKPKVTRTTLIICIIATILVFIAGAFIGTVMDYSSDSNGSVDANYLSQSLELVSDHPLWVINSLRKGNSYAVKLSFLSLFGWAIFLLYKYSEDTRRTHRKGVEHGSAHWGDKKEIRSLADANNKITQQPLKNTDGTLIYDDNGDFLIFKTDNNIILSEDVKLSLNSRQHLLNHNVLVIGGSGSGKSRFVAKPNLMQLNTSYVITDPKGELLQSTGWLLEKAGYNVRILNLIEMNHSSNYNPFHYVYDNDGNLSEDNVKKMVDCLFQNTKGDGEKTDFWAQKGQSLLEAIVFLLFEESEYNAEYEEVTNERTGNKTKRLKPESRDLSNLNFFAVTEKMRKLNYPPKGSKAPDGFFLERNKYDTEEEFREAQQHCFLCPLDKDFIELEKRKGETLAGRLYKEVRNAPEETGQSFLSSANVKTFFFNLTNLSNLTCCDNIHLETLGDVKSALFILTPATNSTYNFIAAMLYTQMFDVLANRANFKHGGVLPVPVRCIMDEFANLGQIPDFDKVIAFVRSMGMSLNVIIQDLAQIKSRYEKTWEIIVGNCDSLIFLGGQEESTLKYLSESLGKETIDVRTYNRTKGKSPSTSESNSIMGRELMTPNEIGTMPITDCIVRVRAHNPFYCKKYSIEKHPNYCYLYDNNDGYKYDIFSVDTMTINEYRKLFNKHIEINEDKKVDININFSNSSEKENTGYDEQMKIRNQKMTTVFKAASSDNMISGDTVMNIYEDYDEDDIAEIIAETTSENIVEKFTRFGEVSDFDSFDLGEQKEEVNKIEFHVPVSKETHEIKHFDEVTSKKEEIQINDLSDLEVITTETFPNDLLDLLEDDTFGFF